MPNIRQLLVVVYSATQSAMNGAQVTCIHAREVVATSQVLVASSRENRQVACATMECARGLRQAAITRHGHTSNSVRLI